LLTVIIPTYNREGFVTDAMDSVFRQNYRPIELIVVDDGSKDDTRKIVQSWIEKNIDNNSFSARYFYQRNCGQSNARNKGLLESSGEFIQFLDSDDVLYPEKLSIQINHLDSFSKASGSYCVTNYVDARGKRFGFSGFPPDEDIALNAVKPLFDCISPLWRRTALVAVGPWDEDLTAREDWVYRARILLKSGPAVFLKMPLCVHRMHEGDRISKHGTKEFAAATALAINRVGELLSTCDSNDRPAKNHLAKEMLAVFKTYLRIQRYPPAAEVLSEALALGTGTEMFRVGAIQILWSILRPKLFRTLVSKMGRL